MKLTFAASNVRFYIILKPANILQAIKCVLLHLAVSGILPTNYAQHNKKKYIFSITLSHVYTITGKEFLTPHHLHIFVVNLI